jgi:hypothetical protein
LTWRRVEAEVVLELTTNHPVPNDRVISTGNGVTGMIQLFFFFIMVLVFQSSSKKYVV